MAFEQGYALLIGVGSYAHHRSLKVPITVADAEEVKKVLIDPRLCAYPDAHVRLLHDDSANKQGVLDELEQLGTQIKPEHTLTIFYAGHGVYGTDGNYYLTTHDTRLDDGKVIPGTGISEGELLEGLRKIKAKRLLLLFNACHAGEISPSLGEEAEESIDSRSLPKRTAEALLSAGEGRIILTACRPTQFSWFRREDRLTIFTQALVDGLSGKGGVASRQGYISAFNLYEHVYEAVKTAAKKLGETQEAVLTVLENVGPFPVALYPGVKERGKFDEHEPLPSTPAVQIVDQKQSQFFYNQIIQNFYAHNQYVAMGNQTFHQYFGVNPPMVKQEADYDQLIKDYLGRAMVDYRTLKFRGLGARERGIEAPGLEHAFITIRMAAEAEAKQATGKVGRRGVKGEGEALEMRAGAETVELAQAVKLAPKLAIIGGAGSGKSTLLQWAGLAAAKQSLGTEALSDEQAAFVQALGEQPLTPLVLPLRTFSQYCREHQQHFTAAGMLRFIHYYLNEKYPTLKLPEDFFAELLKERGCLVMFDGVDEVDPDERANVREAMEALVNEFRGNLRNRYLVTSRTVAYFGESQVSGFRRCDVQLLSPEQRNQLIHNWCEAVDGEEEGCKKADDLIGRIDRSDERVKALAVTPLMVTIFALVYYDQRDLPRQRAELYEHAVRILLTEPYKENETAEQLKKDWEVRRQQLEYIAYQMHDCEKEDLLEDDLVDLAWPNFGPPEEEKGARKLALEFIRKVADRGGLLEEENRRYGFYTHRTFREFLVGRYLAEELLPDEQEEVLGRVLGKDTWREAVRLAAGYLAINGDKRPDAYIRLLSGLGEEAAQHAQALSWAGLCLADLPPKDPQPVKWMERRKLVTSEMLEKLTANPPQITTRLRYELGLVLAEVGDSRFQAKPFEGAKGVKVILPEMVKVEAGVFRMGTSNEDKKRLKEQKAQSWDDEEPAHIVRLSEYRIGKYPVTNAEFRCFFDDHGYTRDDLWSADGRKWRRQEKISQPRYWDDPQWNAANLPVVGVSWFEAEAYCNWLKALTGDVYCLPTEAQWEKAARGEDGRLWSWGNTWEGERCNSRDTEEALNRTSPVGMYPHGASPCGVQDMMGNVWEWCADWYDQAEYQRRKATEVIDPVGPVNGNARGVRGGSWGNDRISARCASRLRYVPGPFHVNLGFRVVCVPI